MLGFVGVGEGVIDEGVEVGEMGRGCEGGR